MACAYDHTRRWPDPDEDVFADPLVLDRHRIVHSMAFRRLQYKTQVFLPFEADHFRTRLTHTLEVAQIGMVLAERFGAAKGLVELICLAHDLGHGPFGHASERALDERLKEAGGFEHNDQSLRVVRYLERPYPYFAGLNLTAAVLAGLSSHTGRYDRSWSDRSGTLESQLASWADRLAYDAGDLEDALGAELVSVQEIRQIEIGRRAFERIGTSFDDRPIPAVRRILCEAIQRIAIDHMSLEPNDASGYVQASKPTRDDLAGLEELLAVSVYRHPQVARVDDLCAQIVSKMFDRYCDDPAAMPQRYIRFGQAQNERIERTIADYISGMTDRFCLKVYRQMFGDNDMLLRSLAGLVNLRS